MSADKTIPIPADRPERPKPGQVEQVSQQNQAGPEVKRPAPGRSPLFGK